MKKFLLSLVSLLALSIGPSFADPYAQEGGLPQGQITTSSTAIAAVDTAIPLPNGPGHIVIQLSAASATVNVNFNNGVATTANYQIPSGGSVTYYGRGLTGIHYIGSAATGNISVLAW